MSWGAVVGAVVTAGAGYLRNKGNDRAANAAQGGYDAATAESGRQYDQSRTDMLPWLNAGQGALSQLQALNSGDFSSFEKSPDYQFRFDQGLQANDRSAAARGSLHSGGHSADLMAYGAGQASQGYGDYYNRLASLAGVGQTAASGLARLGEGYANQYGQNAINAGNMRGSSYLNNANNNSQVLAGLGGSLNNWYQNNSANNGGGTGWYFGNNPGKG